MEELKNIYVKLQPYIIVIFLTISATVFIMSSSSNSSFVENFNFASTITSIILSIIAILLTLIDGEKSNSILEKISKSTETLNKASDKIENFTNQLVETKTSFDNRTLQMEEVLATMFSENLVTQEFDKDKKLNLDFEKLLYKYPHGIRQYILVAYETYKSKKKVDIIDFSNFFKNEMINDDLPGYDIYSDLITTLTVLRGFDLVDFNLDSPFLTVSYIDTELEKAINNVIPSEDYFADAPDLRFFGTVYKYFKSI